MINSILISAVTNFSVVLVMMLVDLITGVAKALQHHTIKSANLRNSINKCIIYFVVLLIGGCLAVAGESGVASIFVVFICLIEGISILENISVLFPQIKIVEKLANVLKIKAKNKVKNDEE